LETLVAIKPLRGARNHKDTGFAGGWLLYIDECPEEEPGMKLRMAVIAVLCIGLFCSFQAAGSGVYAQAKKATTVEQKITVLNPLGTPPPIKLKTMAKRLDTLDGKTIYLVNDGYIGSDNLLYEMQDWFKANYPKTTTIYKRKGGGGFDAEDPALWAEMKEKADGIIIALGH
jgi:hypothetical protein